MARNSYYYTVRRPKHKFCEDFLQRVEKIQDTAPLGTDTSPQANSKDRPIGDTKRCWTALRYPRLWMSPTITALTDTQGKHATTLKDKEDMVRGTAVPRPPDDLVGTPPPETRYRIPGHRH